MTPEKPVLLLHSDNYIRKGEWFKPRDQGRIQCLAAADLIRRDAVSYVVISAGLAAKGADQPPASEPMREQILRNLAHKPEYEERVISLVTATNTLEEVVHAKQFSRFRGWDNFLDIAPEGQVERIRRIVRQKLGKSVPIITSEDYLSEGLVTRKLEKGNSFLTSMARKAVEAHRASREYRWRAATHRRLNRIEAFPGGLGVLFVALASKLLVDKAKTESTAPDWFK